MRCPSCLTENPDSATVCQACGAALDSTTAASAPERSRQWIEEAFRLSDEGRLADAISAAKRAIAADPNATSAYSLLGILYERAGQREQAIDAYESVLRLSPDSALDGETLRQLIANSAAPTPGDAPRRSGDEAKPRPATQTPSPGARRATEPLSAPGAPRLARPAAPIVPATTRRRRSQVVLWSGVALLTLAFIVLLVATIRVWRGAPAASSAVGGSAAATSAPAPTPAAPPSAVTQVPSPAATTAPSQPPEIGPPVAAAVPTVPAPAMAPGPPAVGARQAPAAPPTPAAPAAPPAPTRGPVVSITVPAPDAFITPEPSPPQPPAATAPATPAPNPPGADSARERYLQGDLGGAIRAYESVVAERSGATPHNYQELGWLYYQAGRSDEAAAAYRESLRRYQQEISAGHDVDAARHGIRTAEAALKVIETESGAK